MDVASSRDLWLSGQANRFSPWQQARALAFREASKELHSGEVSVPWVANRVEKVGGGNPSRQFLHEFFATVDADPDWLPGKHSGAKRGPEPSLTKGKRRCLAALAMAAKREGQEPCVHALVEACSKAAGGIGCAGRGARGAVAAGSLGHAGRRRVPGRGCRGGRGGRWRARWPRAAVKERDSEGKRAREMRITISKGILRMST